jgi:hypothetical protein
MRTRVFLVLVALAIGGAGAGIYLALEAESDSVSADDLKAFEQRLGETSVEGASVSSMQTQLNQLRVELEAVRNEAGQANATAPSTPEVPEIEAKPPKKEPQEAEAQK